MPDCAGITLRVKAEDYSRVLAMSEQYKINWEMTILEPAEPFGTFINYDAPWGANYLLDDIGHWTNSVDLSFSDRLIEAEIEFDLFDLGHFTWDASQTAWRVGMDVVSTRYCNVETEPMLTSWEHNQLVAHLGDHQLVGYWVADHFGDDPTLWAAYRIEQARSLLNS